LQSIVCIEIFSVVNKVERYLTSERSEQVRYHVQHEK
jgi:hypothetical protein